LTDLAFLSDCIKKPDVLNLQLRSMGKHVADTIPTVRTFKNKLLLRKSHWYKDIAEAFPKRDTNYQEK
jgi:hypothetical protein